MLRLKFISVILLAFIGNLSYGQKTEILDDFSIYELNGTVYISCTISKGQTCNGINVWRSTDTINFNKVGEVDGICGSSSAPVPYNFTDESPVFNQVSYYKVELGNAGFSETLSIEVIDTRLFGYQVRPNPANENVTIYFNNELFENFELKLFDFMGKLQYQVQSNNNEFRLNTANLKAGNYFFSIENVKGVSNPLRGKLMIQH